MPHQNRHLSVRAADHFWRVSGYASTGRDFSGRRTSGSTSTSSCETCRHSASTCTVPRGSIFVKRPLTAFGAAYTRTSTTCCWKCSTGTRTSCWKRSNITTTTRRTRRNSCETRFGFFHMGTGTVPKYARLRAAPSEKSSCSR